ncbi:hypothetical protein Spiaf_0327 [Spirochaeta africana DSM 8902]|uniref:Rhs family protein n=2 Tax=Spirochaeta TaxID=146 RepID=H9UFZ1_SPIAZ|nr:hypothetical protein Spiaf_0327 [Spirochaeta africana DSM 8902]
MLLLAGGVVSLAAAPAGQLLPEFFSVEQTPEQVAGNPVRLTIREDSDAAAVEEWHFDAEGRLIRKEIRQAGSLPLVTQYLYSPEGRLREWFQEGVDARRLWGYRLEYDDQGRLQRSISEGPGGSIEYIEQFQYHTDTRHESVLYNSVGEPMWRREVERHGERLEWRVRQPNGELFSQGGRKYRDGLLQQEEVQDSGGSIIEQIEYQYDAEGRLVQRDMHDASGLIQRKTHSYINDTLQFTRIVDPQDDGESIEHVLTRKDSHGNWIQRVTTRLFREQGAVSVIAADTRIRDIEYQE